jgi:hypothetical protein
VANVKVTIPRRVAASIHVDKSLSAIDVNESRFPKKGDDYVSLDFSGAQSHLELEIDGNVSRLKIG